MSEISTKKCAADAYLREMTAAQRKKEDHPMPVPGWDVPHDYYAPDPPEERGDPQSIADAKAIVASGEYTTDGGTSFAVGAYDALANVLTDAAKALVAGKNLSAGEGWIIPFGKAADALRSLARALEEARPFVSQFEQESAFAERTEQEEDARALLEKIDYLIPPVAKESQHGEEIKF